MQRRQRSTRQKTSPDDAVVERKTERKGRKRTAGNALRTARNKTRLNSDSEGDLQDNVTQDYDVAQGYDVRAKNSKREHVKPKKTQKSNSKASSLLRSRHVTSLTRAKEAVKTDLEPQVDMKAAVTKTEAKPLYVGAHVSIAGGLENAVFNAISIGANCFALFLSSQRQWKKKPLSNETVETFLAACKEHGFTSDSILPHGSYLLNLGSPDEETLAKSRDTLIDEMSRCQRLGICLYNFHPGSTCGKIPVEESLQRIATSINLAQAQTEGVTAVIENMCCQGSTVGGKFEELRAIIDMVNDKSRVGVCLDTCHAFAAGNDLRTKQGYEKMMSEFDEKIGLEFLKAIHLNDSVGNVGCHLDRHENIGKGKIGLQAFKCVMNDPRVRGIPMILETPGNVDDATEIVKLRGLAEF